MMLPETDTETRHLKANNYNVSYALMDACKEVDQLRAEVARLTADRDSETRWAKEYHDNWQQALADLARLTAERDRLRDANVRLSEAVSFYEGALGEIAKWYPETNNQISFGRDTAIYILNFVKTRVMETRNETT